MVLQKLVGRLEKFKLPIEYHRMPVLGQQGIKVSRADLARWLKRSGINKTKRNTR